MRTNSATQASNPIARDFRHVVEDAQELLKTVEHEGETKLGEARAKFSELGAQATDGAKKAAVQTDQYVHAHPWQAVGVGAAVGAVLGFLIARR